MNASMKTIIRKILTYIGVLYFLPQFIPGVHISDGFPTLLIGGVALTLLFLVLKPILNLISFPVNFVTLGIFSLIVNVLLLYLLTVFVSGINITAFSYPRIDFEGFIIPALVFNTFFAYVYVSFVVSSVDSLITWLTK